MSSRRYWRVFAAAAGSTFALSELGLADGLTFRPAAVTSSQPPIVGDLAMLTDGLASAAVTLPAGAVVYFDLGSAAEVNNLILGTPATEEEFVVSLGLEGSDDGVLWVQERQFYGPIFPGAFEFCATVHTNRWSRSLSSPVAKANFSPDFTEAELGYGMAVAVGAREGKKQVEFVFSSIFGSFQYVGFCDETTRVDYYNQPLGTRSGGYGWRPDQITYNDSAFSAFGAVWGVGDVIGAVLDFNAGTITYYKNGVSQGVAFSGLQPGMHYPAAFNTGSHPTVARVRLAGFDYPIAGAAPWAPLALLAESGYVAQPLPQESVANPLLARLGYAGTRYAPVMRNGGAPYGTDYGTGFIHSTVKRDGDPIDLPMRRKVRLMRERDGRVVGETWSDAATGAYEFNYIDPAERYTVLAYDHEHNFRAVVADNLTPLVAP